MNLNEKHLSLVWGFCLPDGCTAHDFRFFTLFLLHFSEESCQTKEKQVEPYDNADIAAMYY